MSAPSLMPRVVIVAEEAALRRELENSLGNEFNIVKASGYDEAYPLLEPAFFANAPIIFSIYLLSFHQLIPKFP